MSIITKLKDILFEEEEVTEPIKIKEEKKEVKVESRKEEPVRISNLDIESTDDGEIVEIKSPTREKVVNKEEKSDSFIFPDFDEEEFVSNLSRQKTRNTNVLDYERRKVPEKKEYSKIEKIDIRDGGEKKKFKPSPIISPVYGVLNQDYKVEDIVNKNNNASNINIDDVRKKAFEPIKEEYDYQKEDSIDEPVVTFFEEKETKEEEIPERENYKTIDDLLEAASSEISLEDTLEIPKSNNLDVIEEELEKIDEEDVKKDVDDDLDNDLYELIDSMYDERDEKE